MTLSELQADTLFLANTVLAQYKADQIKRNINIAYDNTVLEILKSVSDWEFDESIDSLPVLYTDLVADQNDYQLPTTARQIERVEVKDQNGNYVRVNATDISNIKGSVEELEKTKGVPKSYELVGRSVILYPTPSYSEDEGVMIRISRSVTQLDQNDDEPKIDREFHRLLSLGAALDWAIAKGKSSKRGELEREILKLKNEIRPFYASRNKDHKTRIMPKRYSNYE